MIQHGAQWYVAQTQPHCEGKAASHLIRQGFEVYLPRYLKRRKHARRIETVAAPLFARYLFIAVDMAAQRWRSINSTTGVSRLIGNGDDPAAVSNHIIENLRKQEVDGFVRLQQRPTFARGAKVQVVDGVFASHLGLFDGMTDNQRVVVLLELLGRKVRVLLDELSVAAA